MGPFAGLLLAISCVQCDGKDPASEATTQSDSDDDSQSDKSSTPSSSDQSQSNASDDSQNDQSSAGSKTSASASGPSDTDADDGEAGGEDAATAEAGEAESGSGDAESSGESSDETGVTGDSGDTGEASADDSSGEDSDSTTGAESSDSEDDGGDDSSIPVECRRGDLEWRTGRKTWFESYPDPNSDECTQNNGCKWAGKFAGCGQKMSEQWVMEHNIVAAYPDFRDLRLHDLCLRYGDNYIIVTVYDTCADSDCSGCCSRNQGDTDQLIDMEKYTNLRWDVKPDGNATIEWADLGPSQDPGC